MREAEQERQRRDCSFAQHFVVRVPPQRSDEHLGAPRADDPFSECRVLAEAIEYSTTATLNRDAAPVEPHRANHRIDATFTGDCLVVGRGQRERRYRAAAVLVDVAYVANEARLKEVPSGQCIVKQVRRWVPKEPPRRGVCGSQWTSLSSLALLETSVLVL
jgi:hypothetical protein